MSDSQHEAGTEHGVNYRYNGHDFEVVVEFQGDKVLQCRDCLIKERLDEDDDPKEHLELMAPQCHIEWLREPDGGFHGVALRNASCFRGRELIGVREGGKTGEGKVVDNVRIYDDDAALLASLLDKSEWARREEVLEA